MVNFKGSIVWVIDNLNEPISIQLN